MGSRGRKSSADLEVVNTNDLANEYLRITEPPKDLTDDQGGIWRTVMASSAGDLISTESYDLLKEYCRAVDLGNGLAKQLNNYQWNPNSADAYQDLKTWDKLTSMQARTQGVISTLATKLRIATSSSVRAENAATILKNSSKPALSPMIRPSMRRGL